jgi:primosomal replication protein N
MRNEAVIGGRLLKRGALRYTPAGIPVIDFVIAHGSVQSEAGTKRKVQCDVDAVAVGELAGRIEAVKINQPLQVTGFLARNSIGNRKLTLRATSVEAVGNGAG